MMLIFLAISVLLLFCALNAMRSVEMTEELRK